MVSGVTQRETPTSENTMIIDTHTHFYDPSRPQGIPWPPEDNELLYRTVLPEHHRNLSSSEGVTGTVVVEASAWLDDNQWILDLAADDPWIVGLVGHVDPNRAEFGGEIERLSAKPIKGCIDPPACRATAKPRRNN